MTGQAIRLNGNLPPKVPAALDSVYRAAARTIMENRSPSDLIGSHQFNGSEYDRAAGVRFAARRMPEPPDVDRVVVANGTQAILTMLLTSIVGVGGHMAVEALSYPTVRQFASMFGFKVHGVEMDAEGMLPDALDALCNERRIAACYVMPTLQNPTTSVMGIERRKEIAEICRRHGVAILEDDIYGLLPTDTPPPLSHYAPELAWYMVGTAKAMAPAFKVAYVVAPTAKAAENAFWPGYRATHWMVAPHCAAIVSQLIETEAVEQIIAAVREETRARQALVAKYLAGADFDANPEGLHVWLSLPESRPYETIVEQLSASGVMVGAS